MSTPTPDPSAPATGGGTVDKVQRVTPQRVVIQRVGAAGPKGTDASYDAPLARVAVLTHDQAIPANLPARTLILRRPAPDPT